MTSHISREKNWLTKSYNLCWNGIGPLACAESFVTIVRRHKPALVLLKLLGLALHYFIFRV